MIQIYRRLMDLLDARERRRLLIVFALILAVGVFDVLGVASILPFLALLADPTLVETNPILAGVYERLGFATTDNFLTFLGLLTFVLILVSEFLKAISMYALARFSRMREYTMSSRLLSSCLHQPYAWFLDRNSADLGRTVLSEVGRVAGGVMIPALNTLAQAVSILFLVGLLVVVQPVAALIVAVIVAGSYWLIFGIAQGYLLRIGQDRLGANMERFRIAQEAVTGIKEIKLLGAEERYLERYRSAAARFARRQAAASVISMLPRHVLEAVVFGVMIVFVLVLIQRGSGALSEALPVIGLFAFAGARLFPAVQKLYASVTEVRFNAPSLELLHEETTSARASAVAPGAKGPPLPLNERLELRQLAYSYPGTRRQALRGLDIAIGARTTVAFVGATGAGKTTVVDVILGLLQPQSGALVVDGTIIDGTNRHAWQRSLGYVPQQIFMTDDTVAANIALGLVGDEIDMEAVERAARIAEIHDFVTGELPQGYNTLVGERGVRLSGGQRQRIAIARALYRDPDVLIMDEATSALDNLTERAIIDTVHNLGHRKTIIMIAHRLTTVQACDTIFLLEQGRCIASGSHAELLSDSADFRRLAASAAPSLT